MSIQPTPGPPPYQEPDDARRPETPEEPPGGSPQRETRSEPPSLRPARPRWRETLSLLAHNPTAAIASLVLLFIVIVAVFDDTFASEGANDISVDERLQSPSWAHPFGTDDLGRDILSRVILGASVSLKVGFLAVGFALIAGTLIGLLAGYYGKWVDDVLMRIMDMLFAFPAVLLAIAVLAVRGPGSGNTALAIGIVYTPIFARVTRASVLGVREEVYVRASRSVGASDWRILTRHILPNAAPPIIVQTSISLAFAVLAEAALSFLGLGTQPPDPSWGLMLAEGRGYIELAWWLAFFPGMAIFLTVLCFNLLGDGLRDALDPRQRTLMAGGGK
ncbi:ABC transporter permease [Blastococcus saxobsidens]|uniref:ABC-type dipeptide/oligopeptide/nickel transport system, permease component n=1 Tax=Blastococcus saxobsidens (strain DD2) TaxID=1146883 RepID=H6RM24_BLASD|nr:ABC transporter permease [Blastococcus saxobsidens]CCG01266.1 ABC-type dipeptide/oligopeptide/nickel transport system, permease component [Blastococcus saxobsidens DD2]